MRGLLLLLVTPNAQPRTAFIRCNQRSNVYGAAWLAPAALIARQPLFANKDALEFASFHVLTHATRMGGGGLKASDDAFWVNHVSGFEHAVHMREGLAGAERKVAEMVRVLSSRLCVARTTPPTSTLAMIPFYSGQTKDGARDIGLKGSFPNTGTAHSVSSGATKLKTLEAVLCSALSFCHAVLVGVCTATDRDDVAALLATLPGQGRVVLLKCRDAPAYLPFKLIRLVQRRAKGQLDDLRVAPAARGIVQWLNALEFEFMLYNEADQTLHFEGPGRADAFAVLAQHPAYYVAPQRYEKRWGGIPRHVAQLNLSRAMNKCAPSLPRLAYT